MSELHIRNLGIQDYTSVFNKMREFTQQRTVSTNDEFWSLQHPAVFTLGANTDHQHILSRTNIPIVQSDRGGQVTYHAPGQIIVYLLIDLKRKKIGIKKLVEHIEQALVNLLAGYDIDAKARSDAHGVYVNDAKIASLGLRVHSGCSYHGLALNVDMDLAPFSMINPCGMPGLKVTQLKDFGVTNELQTITVDLIKKLCAQLAFEY
ncbi:MAG: lipoyl(octanoyl) transferase LipB [Pseudomonadota bacterium]